jgi:subtilisin family serine protease
MVRVSSLVLASSALLSAVVSVQAAGENGRSGTNQRSNAAMANGNVRRTNVIVTMKERTDSVIQSVGSQKFASRSQRIGALRESLQSHASNTQAHVKDVLSRAGSSHTGSRSFWLTNQVHVSGATPDLIEELKKNPSVQSVQTEQIYPLVAPITETSALFQTAAVNQWGVVNINAPSVWATGNTGAGVTVGIIDTGVRYTHRDIRPNWRQSKGWYDPETKGAISPAGINGALPYDATGHGTHVTGIVAGQNGIGVAPGARWIACKGCRSTGCFAADLLACFQFMLCPTNPDGTGADCRMAPQIVSNSWGGGQGLTTFDSSITALRAAGIIPVVAAGNTGSNCGTIQSPGDNANVITVGAVDQTNAIAWYSAKGPTVRGLRKTDVMGPGSGIYSSCWTGDMAYCTKSGTSMATPHVSGAIALYLSARPGSTFDMVRSRFQGTALRLTVASGMTCGNTLDATIPNNQFGFGRVDIFRALS